jgi:hypothetical protein
MDGDAGKKAVYNNLLKFKAYTLPDDHSQFHDLNAEAVEARAVSSETKLTFNDKNSHWVWVFQGSKKFANEQVSKNIIVRTNRNNLNANSYSALD